VTVHTSPLIAVREVPASSDWYQHILGLASDMERGHPHRQEYDRIVDDAGQVIISFHSWGAQPDTPMDQLLVDSEGTPRGHGVILSFVLDDVEAAVERAKSVGASLIGDVFEYPDRSRGVLVRDPDGYIFQLSSGARR
jgi:catechol 2,3-dioxygenase-like lactoylglutathione lyase family enzyme